MLPQEKPGRPKWASYRVHGIIYKLLLEGPKSQKEIITQGNMTRKTAKKNLDYLITEGLIIEEKAGVKGAPYRKLYRLVPLSDSNGIATIAALKWGNYLTPKPNAQERKEYEKRLKKILAIPKEFEQAHKAVKTTRKIMEEELTEDILDIFPAFRELPLIEAVDVYIAYNESRICEECTSKLGIPVWAVYKDEGIYCPSCGLEIQYYKLVNRV